MEVLEEVQTRAGEGLKSELYEEKLKKLRVFNLQNVAGEFQVGYQEEFLHGKDCKKLKWTTQGGGGVSILQSIQKMTGCSI